MAQDIDYTAWYDQYINNLKTKATVQLRKAAVETYAAYFEYAEKRVKEIFNDVIQQFYADYPPTLYKRSHSLYQLLDTELKDNKLSLRIQFDPSRMTSFRNGYDSEDGLYDQVFRKGWHGGADKIDGGKAGVYGVHPDPGTPYWRTPHPFYRHWGQKAAVADVPPLEDIRTRVADAQAAEFDSVFRELWEKKKGDIKIV